MHFAIFFGEVCGGLGGQPAVRPGIVAALGPLDPLGNSLPARRAGPASIDASCGILTSSGNVNRPLSFFLAIHQENLSRI
jgi:hypothetical protein